ncbi:LuxR C-terminal-related transcriptional regulator [candidate division KSB1 bacterium]|nr:LuxR C-terminal-related transcriptional regulator [candidate division KSB1 bacterium]
MQQGIERKLILVSAPAGFGKTTLLAEWFAATPASPARAGGAGWVSLDQSDNDPAFFWAYFIKALQKVRSEVGESALSLLHSPQPPPIESVLTNLINDINAIEQDPSTGSGHGFVLILDDYHVIDAQSVHSAIAFLLDHLPPQMHLIIASRSDPPLPLARLRARGESTELRAADLRFTFDEAAAFLNEVMGLDLSATDVAALETRTEGWITGLQLAALSMSQTARQARDDVAGFITAFTGNDRYIVDYLVEEVLQRQPERVRSFLLQTSTLDRLSGPLCDAVTGREDGKRMLEALERGNLFVVPLDDKRQWYRYHHLFADVLRAHAMEEQPDQIPTLHRRAAAWFEERGMAAEAIEQARAAGDHETVARLLVANFEELERIGRYASISRWSASLPEEMVRKRPRLALIHASVALAFDNNNQAARRLTSWAEEAINKIEDGGGFDPSNDVNGTVVGSEGLDALKGEMLAMKLFHSARKLPPEEIAALAGQALKLLPPSKHRLRGMLQMIDAGMQMVRSDLRSALPNLERSVDEARRAQNLPLLVGMLTHRGQVYVVMGRLEDGRRSFEEALLAGQNLSAEANWELCSPHTSLAEVLLERADLAGATDHVARALEFASKSPTRSPVLYARAAAAQVFLAAGDTKSQMARFETAAIEQLEQAQAFVRGSSDSRYFSFLSSMKLKIYCRTGDLEAAADVVRDRNLSPDVAVDRNNEEEMTAFARYLIVRGNYSEAEQVLSRVLPLVRSIGRVQHEIHVLVLEALANELLGERALALESLGRATFLGEPGRFNRTFTSEGPAVAGLMEALADAVQSRPSRPGGTVEAGSPSYLTYLLGEMRVRPVTTSTQSAAAGLVEPLTAREVEILRLIAAGMRNQEIANHLFISLHTVKRHIANAYGKLGVSHRTEAVARVNELKLL